VKKWLFEILTPFFEFDLLKFDPLGKTESSFAFHKVCDVRKLENLAIFLKFKEESVDHNRKNYKEIIEEFWEKVRFFL